MNVVLLVLSALVLIQPMQANEPPPPQKRLFKESAVMAADRMLRDKVREALEGGYFSKGYEYIQVDAKNGVVQLKGIVLTQKDKVAIEARLKKVDGIVRLDNQIEVNTRETRRPGTPQNP